MVTVMQEGPVTVLRMGRDMVAKTIKYYVHAFLIEGIMIDTGPFHVSDELIEVLRPHRIRQIVNTHHHEDHTGNNGPLQKAFGAEILAHPDALAYLADPASMNMNLTQHFFWKMPEPSKGLPIGETVRTPSFTLQVVHTPGHTTDHICLYEPENRWLFAGDLYCGLVKYFRKEERYDQLLMSLKKVRGLGVDKLLCAFKGVVRDGKRALDGKILFMERLREDALKLRSSGSSPKAIRRKLLGAEGAIYYATRGKFSKQNCIDSILEAG